MFKNLSLTNVNRITVLSVLKFSSYIPKGRLNGKVAVVTASTHGIGYGIAERLAKEGAKVVISSRKQSNVDEALAKLKLQNLDVRGLVCHVAKSEDRKKLYDEAVNEFGGIDILVSNAAVNPAPCPVLESDEISWDKVFDVNLKASFLLAKEILPRLEERGGGKIVFMSSIAGYNSQNLLGAYSVSKTALIALSKLASLQLAKKNITVNCVAPGMIKTKFAEVLTENEELRKHFLSIIPMGRFGVPEEICGTVAFLVSNDANYITGETIVIGGGMLSRL
ncbi:hypothetical protein Trydic_g16734 [Trypoxylus dichotomus]